MFLLLIFGGIATFALAVEVLNFTAREFLSGVRREDVLKSAIRQTQKDLAEADEKISGIKSKLRHALNDLDKVKTAYHETEKEIARRNRVDPLLVHLVGAEAGTGFRFRAQITKVLPEKPDPNQTVLWGKDNFVEVWATTEDEARATAVGQFPTKQGYTIGSFVRTGNDGAIGKAA